MFQLYTSLILCYISLSASRSIIRKNVISLPLEDNSFYLSTNFIFNENNVSFLLDSGSSDTWVLNSNLCDGCDWDFNSFNSGTNTSFAFETEYFGGQEVEGNLFIASNVNLDGYILNNKFYYGLINQSENTVTNALIGIAKPEMQSQHLYTYENSYNGTYPSLLTFIDGRNTYFIDLPNQQFQIGSHLEGEVTIPLIVSSDYYALKIKSFHVQTAVDKIKTNTINLAGSNNFTVILDTGSSVLQLPNNIVESFVSHFDNSYWDEKEQSYMLKSCPNDPSSLPLLVLSINNYKGFNKSVKIRGEDLVVEVENNVCALAISPSDFGVLGIPFFRSGAVGIDLDKQVVHWRGLIR
ncbi:hypothetical protein QEN19_000126 [Hanseniaspora menglaensis]